MSRRGFQSKHHQQHWKKSARNRGDNQLFGGKIVSQEEIAALDERNALAEEVQFEAFEAKLDQEIDQL